MVSNSDRQTVLMKDFLIARHVQHWALFTLQVQHFHV